MGRMLEGIRVVEVAMWWFVPSGGAVLSDWGADVIKIEHPVTGDPQRGLVTSGFFPPTGGVNFMMEQSNRGKRSVGIDLGNPRGREVLLKLVATADVFLTNFLPAARRKLRIDVERGIPDRSQQRHAFLEVPDTGRDRAAWPRNSAHLRSALSGVVHLPAKAAVKGLSRGGARG